MSDLTSVLTQILGSKVATEALGAERLAQDYQVQWSLDFGLNPDHRTLGVRRASMYSFYPYLFRSLFPSVSQETVAQLALCARFYASSLFLADKFMDRDLTPDTELILVHNHWVEFSVRMLSRIFHERPAFWEYFEVYKAEYTSALTHERLQSRGRLGQYDPQVARLIHLGKSAMAKFVPAGLAVLADREDLISPLACSHDHLHIANQIFDDLRDWKADYERGCYSPIIQRIIAEAGLTCQEDTVNRPSSAVLSVALHRSGLSVAVLEEALQELNLAQAAVDHLPAEAWKGYIALLSERIRKLKDDLADLSSRLG